MQQQLLNGQANGPNMANQDELSGDESRDLIDDRQHAVDIEDDIDDYATQFDLINQ